SHVRATSAFRALGSIAKPAIPALADRFAQGNGIAAMVLTSIGLDAGPALTNALANTNQAIRSMAIQAMETYLTKYWKNTYFDPDPKYQTELRAAAMLIVPALVRSLRDPDENVRQSAYSTLTFFNQASDISTPLLIELMSDKDPKVR